MTMRIWWCWLRGGFAHSELLVIEGGRLYLRCGRCGKTSAGIWIGVKANVIVMSVKKKTAA